MRKANALLFVVFALAFTVFAEEPKESTMPDPMLRQLDYFAGTWQCRGIAYANPMAPEHASSAEVTAKWSLGGYWMPVSYTEKKSAQNAMPFALNAFFGYDPQMKQFVIGGVDNMGGYSTGSSDGWDGDTMIFAGPWHMASMTANSRDTFTKKSAREFTHLGEIEMNGQWVKLGMETCTKK